MKLLSYLREHKSVGTIVALASVAAVALVVRGVSAQVYSPLSGTMSMGSRGADVTTLQRFLANSPDVYPQALVTGYYGPLTQKAVTNFQIGYNIPAVGNVGPITLGTLNSLISNGLAVDVAGPYLSGINVYTTNSTASITWSTSENSSGKVYFSSAPITGTDASQSKAEPYLSGTAVAASSGLSHTASLSGLSPNTTYYYVVESADMQGNVTVSTQGKFVTNM